MKLPRILVTLALAGTLAGCTAPDGGDGAAPTDKQIDSVPAGSAAPDDAAGDDVKGKGEAEPAAGGIIEGGSPVTVNLGEPVTYYSFASLSQDDVQRVTINAVDYIELADLGAEAPLEKMTTGIIVVDLIWEQVHGQVQSNQGYLRADTGGNQGTSWAFREERMRNGRVEVGTPKTGTFTIEIDRGYTILTLVDYLDFPVAILEVDTSK